MNIHWHHKIGQAVSLITCCLLILAVAVQKNGRVFGHDLSPRAADIRSAQTSENQGARTVMADSAVRTEADGTIVISTATIGRDIRGFAGPTPVEIRVRGAVVRSVRPLDNAESPAYFDRLTAAGLFGQWDGLSVADAAAKHVDAVSGATFSSEAVIENVRCGLERAAAIHPSHSADVSDLLSVRTLAALLVILLAVVLPQTVRWRHLRTVQLVLDVVVLGLWSGTFLSYALLVRFFSDGLNVLHAAPYVLILIVALVLPLFGRKAVYCSSVCPLGALQELSGRVTRRRLRLTPVTVRRLERARDVLWCVLMLVMWTGVTFSWMDYELFTAFLFRDASWAVIAVAVAFVALSAVVTRPYCRFVCPTGRLLRLSETSI